MQQLTKYIAFIALCFITFNGKAQANCKNAIYDADKLFEAGQIKESINRLEPCLPNIHDKEELIESYHLLAQAYQILNNSDKAKFYIRKMLQLKPDYKRYPNIDAIDFNHLVNQFKVLPNLYLGLKFGFNTSVIVLQKSYSVYASHQSYNPAAGYQFGFHADYRILPGLSINPELILCGIKINHTIDSAGGEKQNYNEQQNYGMLNIAVQKHIAIKEKLNLFAGVGFGVGYLLTANVNLESNNLESGYIKQVSKNPIAERNKVQPSIIALAGIGIRISKGILNVEVNYAYFLSTTVKQSKRMSDLDFIFNNQYVNDDISLRTAMFNLSYKIPLLWSIKPK
jgi:hypothetical protein